MSKKRGYREIIESFSERSILILGDVMLDQYFHGKFHARSPEAPVPVVKHESTKCIPGGAANVSNNIKSLSGAVYTAGVIGDDYMGKELTDLLNSHSLNPQLFTEEGRKTTLKMRVVDGQQMIRLDTESTHDVQKKTEDAIDEYILNQSEDLQAIVLSDYAKGTLTKALCQRILKYAAACKIPVLVDPKPSHAPWYHGCTLLTPNHKEACQMSHYFTEDYDNENKDEIMDKIGKKIKNEMAANVLITRGAHGMSLYEKRKPPVHIPTKAIEVFDVSGAGDTVIATAALAIAAGATLYQASVLANYAASVVCKKEGTATLSRDELLEVLNKDKAL